MSVCMEASGARCRSRVAHAAQRVRLSPTGRAGANAQVDSVYDEVNAAADKSQSLLDPKVKKRLLLVFHAWSIQYAVRDQLRATFRNSILRSKGGH